MKKNMRLLQTLLIFFIGFSFEAISGEKVEVIMSKESGKTKFFTQLQDTSKFSSLVFIEQEFNYYAPLSGNVYLAWKAENYTLEELGQWNENTKLSKGLLYIPMVALNDTFSVKLKVPIGASIQYYFWITKSKQGHYQDFWDLRNSGKTTVNNLRPISKNAVYSKEEKKLGSRLMSFGWKIFIVVLCIYLLLIWLYNKLGRKFEKPLYREKVLFMGVSLTFFYALARAEIIGVNPLNFIQDYHVLLKIARGSYGDFTFIWGFVFAFCLLFLFVKKELIKKIGFGIFLFVAFISILMGYTNITTVIFLGKPFTYQWLYYSDFLGSTEAKTAIVENLSFSILGNLLAIAISMVLLSIVLNKAFRLLTSFVKAKYILFPVIGLVFLILFLSKIKTQETWTKGQSENAILSMIFSILSADSNSSFFSANISDVTITFEPGQSILDPPYLIRKDHGVKNVVFVILESAGACYFDGYGGKFNLSPNLNKYASHALIFDQMYAHAPATNLSLASILGSMYPYLSYKSLTQEAPDVKYPTLSSVLKSKGYRTSFFSSADLRFQNCKEFLAHRGFDVVDDFSSIPCSELFQEDKFKELNGIDDLCLSDHLTSWLDEDLNKNFFSVIWTVQGHYPYFFNKSEEDFGVNDINFNRYLNCLKHDDKLIGDVLHGLELRGLDSTTLVVVMGDHGEAFGQHNQYGHGTAIYEENLRVPLYFINPTLFHGERNGDVSGMKDLASTTLTLLNVEIPKIWQGRDLLSTSSNENFYFSPWSDYLFGYRKDNMKYIFNESRNTVEVYDLQVDPNEKNNLYPIISKEEILKVRNRVSGWVQYQDKFLKGILKVED